ncbi:hypothetical protein [Halorubrum tropicale]|uniref:hypothetical protein n=1 Tax=Halorubrum tropicale TaxID=1765655 RepID=UPI0006B1FDA9|nr:hypothetical protein [Halorubrum tropicale]
MSRTALQLTERTPTPSSRQLRQVAVGLVATSLLSAPVAAQSAAEEAASAMCETGLGSLITFVLGLITVGLVLLSAFRGAIAWNNLGSARTDKKQQGRDQLKGAGITLGGAFLPPIFGVALDQGGIDTLSCVNFGNVLVITPVDVVAQLIVGVPL